MEVASRLQQAEAFNGKDQRAAWREVCEALLDPNLLPLCWHLKRTPGKPAEKGAQIPASAVAGSEFMSPADLEQMETMLKPPKGRWGYQAPGELIPVRMVAICDDEEALLNFTAWVRRELTVVQIKNSFAPEKEGPMRSIQLVCSQYSEQSLGEGYPRGVALLCEIEVHLRKIRDAALGFLWEHRQRLPRETRPLLDEPIWKIPEESESSGTQRRASVMAGGAVDATVEPNTRKRASVA